nr:coenzyme F420 hydrogenase/dehydrogenase beta subunit N-terminal domain-containing protein [Methanosarcina horonobensis]
MTCVSARSTDKEILKKAQDGGIATTLMVYASSRDNRWGYCGRRGRPTMAAQAIRRDEPQGHPQGTRGEV